MKKKLMQIVAFLMIIALLASSVSAAQYPGGFVVPPSFFPPGVLQPGQNTDSEEVEEVPDDESGEILGPEVPAQSGQGVGEKIVRIGLYYGSDALDGANLLVENGAGYYFGYYNSQNEFVPVASYASKETISVVKTENVYYGTYNGYASYYDHLTSSSVVVGCYHLQLPGSHDTYDEALAQAELYENGFVAYIGGTYYVRIGNYPTRDSAVNAQNALLSYGVSADLKGTSSYGVNIVLKGTNRIIFQYDDNGAGTGLGIQPIPAFEGQKCSSAFKNLSWYGGFRYERMNGGDLTIVNMVAMDDYIKGVIPWEMSASWPIEALKAQTVSARTYTMYNLNRHRSSHFDLCNENHCQVYQGLSRANANSDAAVDQTKNVVATYNNKIIGTFYYSSNGGASENADVVWGGYYPYLVGVVDPYEATVEKSISGYRWTRQYTGEELAGVLKSGGYACSKITGVEILSYTNVGNPLSVKFTDSNGKSYTLTARGMVTLFKFKSYRYDLVNATQPSVAVNEAESINNLSGVYVIDGNGNVVQLEQNSACIIGGDGKITTLEPKAGVTGNLFTFAGAGSGHNVGMSQWGAYAMAKQGYTYDEILKFYYSGIAVEEYFENI